MAKYKVGDKVKIRSDLKAGTVYGGLELQPEMEHFRGKTGIVQNAIDGLNAYDLDVDNDAFWWSDDMIEEENPHSFSLLPI